MAKKNPNPVDKDAGARVRMRRLQLGMSQTQLAEAIGLTFQQVQKYEKGTNRMGSSRLQQIANILDVPVSYFFGEQSGAAKAAEAASDYISKFLGLREGHVLAKSFVGLKSSKLRHVIVKLVALLAERQP